MTDPSNNSTSKEITISSECESQSADCTSVIKRKIPFESDYCKRSCMKLYLQEDSADVYFLFVVNGEEKKLPAHKYILAIGSPVFQSMFYGGLKEEGDVTITDATMEAFEEFLQFFYLADVAFTVENAAEVMNLANKYAVVECFSICEQFLLQNINMGNVCGALELAALFGRTEFRQSLLKKVSETPREVFASDSFKECTPDTLKMILECENLNCKEKAVFDACIAWAKSACVKKNLNPTEMANIRQQLGESLYLIKFSEMLPIEISSCVSTYQDLFSREELVEIIAILSADNRKKLRYFSRKNEVKTIEWKNYATLMFSQIDFVEADVTERETTILTTNRKVILGAVATQIIHSTKNGIRELQGSMSIYGRDKTGGLIHHLTQPFTASLGGKFVPRNFTKLTTPLVIEANTICRIEIDFPVSLFETKFATKRCERPRSISIQNFTVKFVGGIISHLYFN